MKKYKKHILVFNLILILGYFGFSVFKKQTILDSGTLVLLELTPVDPRSLMQGDYMRLQYKMTQESLKETSWDIQDSLAMRYEVVDPWYTRAPKQGYVVVELDTVSVGHFVGLYDKDQGLKKNQIRIQYHKPSWSVRIGAESFFFEEGMADRYEQAHYGGLKVDDKGHSVLVGLYTKDRILIK